MVHQNINKSDDTPLFLPLLGETSSSLIEKDYISNTNSYDRSTP